MWKRAARSFEEMTNLPAPLRPALAEAFSLTPLEPDYVARSKDGTIKHLWRLEDGERVESVLIPTRERLTLCLSSQAGCALACRFCATGYFGFRRQLRAAEIVAQYRDSLRVARKELGRPISNVVYMGMGEPLANLDGVIGSLAALQGLPGLRRPARRITVSTVGLVPGSSNSRGVRSRSNSRCRCTRPAHELRLELMPIEKRYPLRSFSRRCARTRATRTGASAWSTRSSAGSTMRRRWRTRSRTSRAVSSASSTSSRSTRSPRAPEWGPSPPAAIERFSAGLTARG